MIVPHREGAVVNNLAPNFKEVAHDELLYLGTQGANLLLIGVNCAGRERVEIGLGPLMGPLSKWEPGEQLVLPAATDTGTLILHEVGSLTHDDQLRLLAWQDENAGRTRIVCTTSASLFARVEAGVFIEKLYYRLNTVTFNLSTGSGIRRPPMAATRW